MVDGLPLIGPDLDDFYEAWHWLRSHPYFRKGEGRHAHEAFAELVEVLVVKINPERGKIDDDPTKNTQVEFWLEAMTWDTEDGHFPDGIRSHDWKMDVSAPTYEEAMIKLARNVMERVGDYPAWSICSHCLVEKPAGPRGDDDHWFCSPECEEHGPYKLLTRPVPDRDDVVEMIPSHEQFGCEHFPPE